MRLEDLAVPPRVLIRSDFEETEGDWAYDLAEGYGLTLDDWQAYQLELWLARGASGKLAHGTVASIVPRQNGKNAALEVRQLYGLVILGEKWVHTAHEVKTCRKAFLRLASFFDIGQGAKREMAALVKEIRHTNGQEAVRLTNGASIEFIARSRGSGRGYTVDCLSIDEAQDSTDEELTALIPIASSGPRRDSQVIYLATPPDPAKATGDAIRRLRQAVLMDGKTKGVMWAEYGAPDGPLPDVDDHDLLHAVNPAIRSGRLSVDYVDSQERPMMSVESFARDRLGWWGDPDRAVGGAVDLEAWQAAGDPEAPAPTGKVILVADVAPDRSRVVIATASKLRDKRIMMMVYVTTDIDGAAERIRDLRAKRDVAEVALVVSGQGRSLQPALDGLGVEYTKVGLPGVAAATGWLIGATARGGVLHLRQPELDSAVKTAVTRMIGESEIWHRGKAGADVVPLLAVSVAGHLATKLAAERPNVYASIL